MAKNEPLTLDDRIIATLTKSSNVAEAENVLAIALDELKALDEQIEVLENESLSPLLSRDMAAKKRTEAVDTRFAYDRMDASVSALRAHLEALREAARHEIADTEKADAIAERDELALHIRNTYPDLLRSMTDMVFRIQMSDKRCREARLYEGSAEAFGRGIPATFSTNGEQHLRLAIARLPTMDGRRLGWEETTRGWEYPGLES